MILRIRFSRLPAMPQAVLWKVEGWFRGFFLAPAATSQVQKDESLDYKNLGLLFLGLDIYWTVILVHELEPASDNGTVGI